MATARYPDCRTPAVLRLTPTPPSLVAARRVRCHGPAAGPDLPGRMRRHVGPDDPTWTIDPLPGGTYPWPQAI